MNVAKFPAYRDLTGFDFSQSLVDEALVKSLHHAQFLEDSQNVVLVGGPGTGKTNWRPHRRAGRPAPSSAGPVPVHHRTGQCPGAGEAGRAARRADRIRSKLGWEPGILNCNGGKPRGMHWNTFERLTAQHDSFVRMSLVGMSSRLNRYGQTLAGWGLGDELE